MTRQPRGQSAAAGIPLKARSSPSAGPTPAEALNQLPFPCFPPNQPDLNVLTEVAASSGFQALESACGAAYIGELTLKWHSKSAAAPTHHAHGESAEGTIAGAARIFKLHSHSGKYGAESEICKRFTEIGRMPGNVACSLASLHYFSFVYSLNLLKTRYRQRFLSGRFGFILLAANRSTLCVLIPHIN